MAEETIIREFRTEDLEAIVELSLRAWEPVFDSLLRLKPNGSTHTPDSPRQGQFELLEGALCLDTQRARRRRAEVDTHDHRVRGRGPAPASAYSPPAT